MSSVSGSTSITILKSALIAAASGFSILPGIQPLLAALTEGVVVEWPMAILMFFGPTFLLCFLGFHKRYRDWTLKRVYITVSVLVLFSISSILLFRIAAETSHVVYATPGTESGETALFVPYWGDARLRRIIPNGFKRITDPGRWHEEEFMYSYVAEVLATQPAVYIVLSEFILFLLYLAIFAPLILALCLLALNQSVYRPSTS